MSISASRIREQILKTETEFPIPAWDTDRLANRCWILELLEPGGVGMEVGVFRGRFTELILEIAKPRKLYLIDPWTLGGETFGWGKEYTNFGTLPTAVARDETRLRTQLHPRTEAVIIEGTFPQCSDQIAETLDWAYLDASHKYEQTMNELRHLETLVRPDGMILGDDWNPDPSSVHHGVFRAVTDFVEKSPWTLFKAGRGMQWAIRRTA